MIDELRAALDLRDAELMHLATIVKARQIKVRADKRLKSQIVDQLRQPPSPTVFAEVCKRRNAILDEVHLVQDGQGPLATAHGSGHGQLPRQGSSTT